jgi:hypothetical protein
VDIQCVDKSPPHEQNVLKEGALKWQSKNATNDRMKAK